MLNHHFPVPASVALKVAPLAGTWSVAASAPLTCGVKVTLIWQLAPAARLAPHVLVSLKDRLFDPTIRTLPIAAVEAVTLVTVTTCAPLLVPLAWLPKLTLPGVTVS